MTEAERVAGEEMRILLPDPAATGRLAAQLAAALPARTAGCLLLLQGELGAGKSTLARAMLRELGHTGPAPSPTYTLVEPYELSIGIVYHVDLYRVAGLQELDYLGWNDMRDGLILLEWPERVPRLVEQADLKVVLEYNGDGRRAALHGLSGQGTEILRKLGRHS